MATRDQCKRAKALHGQRLAKVKHFNGLGITPDPDQPLDGPTQYAVAVYVTEKLPKEKLSPEDLVPSYLEIPGKGAVIRVPTQVIELAGELERQTAQSQQGVGKRRQQ